MVYATMVKIAVIAPMTVEEWKSATIGWIMIAMAPLTALIRIVVAIPCVRHPHAAVPSSRVDLIQIVARRDAK